MVPTRSRPPYMRTRRAGVHVSSGFRNKASPRPERGGFLPRVHDSVLRERGDQALRERYEPLRAEP